MINKLLIILIVIGLVNSQQQIIKFNTELNCSEGCEFTSDFNWVGGQAPSSPDQIAVIDFSQSQATNINVIILSSAVAVGGINVTSSSHMTVQFYVRSNVKTYNITLSQVTMNVQSNCSIVVTNLFSLSNAVVVNNGALSLPETTLVGSSKLSITGDVIIQNALEIGSGSSFIANNQVTVEESGSISVSNLGSFTSTTPPNILAKSSFSNINTQSGSTFLLEEIYKLELSTSQFSGTLQVSGNTNANNNQNANNNLAINGSFIQHLSVGPGNEIPLSVQFESSTIHAISNTNGVTQAYMLFEGSNSIQYSFQSTDADLVSVVLLPNSVLELGGQLSLLNDDASILLESHSNLIANNVEIKCASLISVSTSNAQLTLTNGGIDANIVVDRVLMNIGGLIVHRDISVSNSNISVTDGVEMYGNFRGTHSAINLLVSTLPTSTDTVIFNFASGGSITMMQGTITFGVSLNSQGQYPTIVQNQTYYLIGSQSQLSLSDVLYRFVTPYATDYTPSFSMEIDQGVGYYLTVTFQ